VRDKSPGVYRPFWGAFQYDSWQEGFKPENKGTWTSRGANGSCFHAAESLASRHGFEPRFTAPKAITAILEDLLRPSGLNFHTLGRGSNALGGAVGNQIGNQIEGLTTALSP